MSYAINSVLLDASRVPITEPVTIKARNIYTIASNVLSCNDTDVYTLTDLNGRFGEIVRNPETSGVRVKLGNTDITAGDFGILFSCLVAMNAAYTEAGTGVPAETIRVNGEGMSSVWFGNHGVIYNHSGTFILPVRHTDVRSLCCWNKVQLRNFASSDIYIVMREGTGFVVTNEKTGVVICSFTMPYNVRATYPTYFDGDRSNDVEVDMPETEWDDGSELGVVLSEAKGFSAWQDTINLYQHKADVLAAVVRDDLICTPTKRYDRSSDFHGKIYYSDEATLDLAVNLRGNLYVYRPWFTSGDITNLAVREAPTFANFFDVTEECNRIAKFAKTVTSLPITVFQFNSNVLEQVKNKFTDLELSRVNIHGAMGRVVIPEKVLVGALSKDSSATAYCLCPVGVIGSRVIALQSDGTLTNFISKEWGVGEAFYDITEVIERVKV